MKAMYKWFICDNCRGEFDRGYTLKKNKQVIILCKKCYEEGKNTTPSSTNKQVSKEKQMEIKRYNIDIDCIADEFRDSRDLDNEVMMEELPGGGNWVKYEDMKKMAEENEILRKENHDLRDAYQSLWNEHKFVIGER